jgi:endonuclease/exonuclease/phosphatase family metal-dependent hydrolase
LSYNTNACWRLQQIFELLKVVDADIICLQEVMLCARYWKPANQAAWLADQLGMDYVCGVLYGDACGLGGNVILSRGRLLESRVLTDCNSSRFGLGAVVEHYGVRLAVVCSHFKSVPKPLPIGLAVTTFQRSVQIRRSLRWIRQTELPGILAGDFNCLPYMLEYHAVVGQMIDCSRAVSVNHRNTRPTWCLPIQIDYVFATADMRTLSWRTIDFGESDHRPILAEIALSNGATGAKRPD